MYFWYLWLNILLYYPCRLLGAVYKSETIIIYSEGSLIEISNLLLIFPIRFWSAPWIILTLMNCSFIRAFSGGYCGINNISIVLRALSVNFVLCLLLLLIGFWPFRVLGYLQFSSASNSLLVLIEFLRSWYLRGSWDQKGFRGILWSEFDGFLVCFKFRVGWQFVVAAFFRVA